jgi:hypothetical protein
MRIINFLALTFAVFGFTALSAQQQAQQRDKEKIKADKIAYITTQLDLSVEEAQKFWPVYNEFEKKNEELNKSERDLNHELKTKGEQMSDTDFEKKLDQVMLIQKSKSDLQTEYYQKFKKVLPIKKVGKFYAAEREFRKQMLHEYGKCYGKGSCAPPPQE